MKQSTITCYFKKEIDIDWDEADNCYGEAFDDVQEEKYTATVALENLPDSILQKHIGTNNLSSVPAHPEYTEKCSRCKKKFKNKNVLMCHSRYCGKERNLKCAHCSYKTKHKINLIVHLSKIHPDGKNIDQTEQDDLEKFTKICQSCNMISETLWTSACEKCLKKLVYQCKKCFKQFKTYSLAYYHWDTRCGVKGYFNCNKCDFKSVWRSKVVKHKKQSHQISETSEEFTNIQWIGLNQSVNQNPESRLHECPKCTKIMKNAVLLSRHIRLCGGLECVNNSDTVFKDHKNAQNNIQLEHNKCSKCGRQFNHIYSLNKHARYCSKVPFIRTTNDSDVEVVDTDADLFTFPIPADQRRARIREMVTKFCARCQEESAVKEGWGMSHKESCKKCKTTLFFKCKKCLKAYTRYTSIFVHLKNVCDPQEEFKCSECDFKALAWTYISNHYRSVHGTSNIECKKCGKKFKSSEYLNRHLRRCGVEAKFQCEHCPFKSKLKIYLRKHIFRSHMEPVVIDRRESIKMSKQRFSRAKIHLKAHCFECKKEQPLGCRLKICRNCKTTLSFKCKTCKKKYPGDDESACEHVKGYLETIKFECKRCGRGAISEKSLWMHEHSCGSKATFRCRFCKFASKQKGNLLQHEKRMHPLKA